MGLRIGSAAIAWAVGQNRRPMRNWNRDCLMFTRMCFNVGPLYPTAESGYFHTRYRHPTGTPPPGVPVWWTDGRQGHVALSAGGGYVWTNDYKRKGKIDKVPIAQITRAWGKRYRGWSEDINGVRVYKAPVKPPVAPRRTVDLSNVRRASVGDVHRRQGSGMFEADVKLVEAALKSEGLLDSRWSSDGYWGSTTSTAYAKWQRRAKVGRPYDGIPGQTSLTRLGTRHGFTVKN
jgi:hypothetical protein